MLQIGKHYFESTILVLENNMHLLLLILQITTCMATVYNITPISRWTDPKPDYHFNTIKDFVSNMQLHFLRGTHVLHMDFIIQNVDNISLTGEVRLDYQKPSIIHCFTSSVNIVFRRITNLTIKNIVFSECQTKHYGFFHKIMKFHMLPENWAFILIHDCYNVNIQNVTLKYNILVSSSLMIYNVLGKSILTNIKSNQLSLMYTDLGKVLTKLNHELTICSYNFEFFDHEFQKEYE